MYRSVLAMGLVLWLAGCLAPMETMPAAVRSAVETQLGQAGLKYGRAAAFPDFINRAAFSSDEATDWVIDYNQAHGSYCGASGCPLQVWVEDGDGAHRLAFDQQVLSWRATTDEARRTTLAVKLHGALCGRSGIEDCAYAFRWSGGADGHFTPIAPSEGGARSSGPLVQPIRLNADDAPTPARYAVKAYEAACMRAGGVPETGQSLQYLPDLNGDEAREMLFDASIAWCRSSDGVSAVRPDCKAGACDSRLFSRQGDVWREVLASPALRYEIEYAQGSAPVMKINGQPLTWSGTAPTS